MNTKHKPQDESVNINELPQQRAADYLSMYSNHAQMGFSPWDVTIFFCELTEDENGDIIREQKARVVMSPQHAIAFSKLLNNTVDQWAKKHASDRQDGPA